MIIMYCEYILLVFGGGCRNVYGMIVIVDVLYFNKSVLLVIFVRELNKFIVMVLVRYGICYDFSRFV